MIKSIKNFFLSYSRALRARSVEMTEWEVKEMEKIFTLLLFGFITGSPSAPINISLELLDVMDNNIESLLEGITMASDPMAELFSLLDIG
jgi:hypothetical protein